MSGTEPNTDNGTADSNGKGGGSPIVLRFDLTEHDMAMSLRAAESIDPAAHPAWNKVRRQYKGSIAVAIVLTGLLAAGFATDTFGMGSIEGRPVLALAVGAAVAGAWWTVAQYRRTLAPVSRAALVDNQVRTEEVRYHLGPQVLTIGPDRLALSMRHHDITQRWSGIAEVHETPDGVYFRRLDRHAYLVPKRIFASPDEAKAIVARARAWLDEAGHGDGRRIRAFLAERDVPCPACGYNLRGASNRTCPECGRELDAGLLAAGSP